MGLVSPCRLPELLLLKLLALAGSNLHASLKKKKKKHIHTVGCVVGRVPDLGCCHIHIGERNEESRSTVNNPFIENQLGKQIRGFGIRAVSRGRHWRSPRARADN